MACEWTHHVSYRPGLIAVCIRPDDLKGLFNEERFKKLVIEIGESNPREIKRFIRNLIFSFRIMDGFIQKHSDILRSIEEEDMMKFVTLQAINFRWNDLYELILYSDEAKRGKFFDVIKKYSEHRRFYNLLTISLLDVPKRKVKRIIKKYDKNEEFKEFLRNYHESLSNISAKQWNYLQTIFRKSSFSSSQIVKDNTLPESVVNKKSAFSKVKNWVARKILRRKEKKTETPN